MAGDDRTGGDAAAATAAARRDGLGLVCHRLHLAIMVYFVAGWAAPWHGALYFYLAFVPAVALQWQFNANACVLNNLESWLRTRPLARSRQPGGGRLARHPVRGHAAASAPARWRSTSSPMRVLLALWSMALIHLVYF